jgi:hypothetical protein
MGRSLSELKKKIRIELFQTQAVTSVAAMLLQPIVAVATWLQQLSNQPVLELVAVVPMS